MSHKPFFYSKTANAIHAHMLTADDKVRAHFQVILSVMEGKTPILAATKTLNRYSILPGKIFSTSSKSKTKYKILRLVADDVVLQDLHSQKVETVQINKLLKRWADDGIQEISLLDEIISTVKSFIGPVLGAFLTTALISWLTDKLSR